MRAFLYYGFEIALYFCWFIHKQILHKKSEKEVKNQADNSENKVTINIYFHNL